MTVQLGFSGVRPDRHHREKKHPDHEQPQLFAFGKFIGPPRKRASAGGKLRLELVDLRTDYEKMKEIHADEIR